MYNLQFSFELLDLECLSILPPLSFLLLPQPPLLLIGCLVGRLLLSERHVQLTTTFVQRVDVCMAGDDNIKKIFCCEFQV